MNVQTYTLEEADWVGNIWEFLFSWYGSDQTFTGHYSLPSLLGFGRTVGRGGGLANTGVLNRHKRGLYKIT